MNKILWPVLIFLLLTASPARAKEQDYVIGYGCMEAEYCLPPEFRNILIEAYARIGQKIKFKQLPLLRDLEDANNSLIAASSYRTRSAISRFPNMEIVPVPLFEVNQVVFTLEGDIKIDSWTDMGKYRIGVLRGDLTINQVAEENGVKLYQLGTMDQGLKMMEQARLDAVISIDALGLKVADKLGIDVHMSKPILPYAIYHAVNKKYEHLIPGLTASFTSIIKDGTMKRLLGSYKSLLPPQATP